MIEIRGLKCFIRGWHGGETYAELQDPACRASLEVDAETARELQDNATYTLALIHEGGEVQPTFGGNAHGVGATWGSFVLGRDSKDDGCLSLDFAMPGLGVYVEPDRVKVHFGRYSADTLRNLRAIFDLEIANADAAEAARS